MGNLTCKIKTNILRVDELGISFDETSSSDLTSTILFFYLQKTGLRSEIAHTNADNGNASSDKKYGIFFITFVTCCFQKYSGSVEKDA